MEESKLSDGVSDVGAPPIASVVEDRVSELRAALDEERRARQRAEEALLITRFAVDNAVEPMFTLSTRGQILDANATAVRRYGIERSTLVAMNLEELEPDPEPGSFAALWRRLAMAETVAHETVHTGRHGRTFPVEISLARFDLGGQTYCCASVRDLTERNRAERAMRESEQRLRALLDHLPAAVVMKSLDGRIMLANREFESWFALAPGESSVKTSYELLGPDVGHAYRAADRRVLDSGEAVQWEMHLRTGDGVERSLAVTEFPIPGGSDTVAIGSIGVDVSPLKRVERALRESERRFELAVHGSTDGFWDQPDCTSDSLWWSPRIFVMLGHEPAAFEPTHSMLLDLIHPDDIAGYVEARELHFEKQAPFDVECRLVTREQGYRWFRMRGRSLRDGRNRPVRMSGSMQDITDAKHAEERRIAAVRGQRDALVREVHHRIKNHLQGIIGLLTQYASRDPGMEEAARRIRTQVNSIAVVHGLQGQDRDGVPALGAMVDAILQSARGVYSHRFDSELDRSPVAGFGLSDREAVPVALILNELVTNAIKHCDSGRAGGRAVRVVPLSDGAWIGLRVVNVGGRLPDGFDFDLGTGLGTGLSLVRALLPPEGVALRFDQLADGVAVEMKLRSPVVFRWPAVKESREEERRTGDRRTGERRTHGQ